MIKQRNLYKIALQFAGLIFCIVAAFSCFSFDIYDSPSVYAYPHNSPVANWCGIVGSFLAYYSLYYIGPGVFVAAISLGIWLGLKIIGAEYRQLFLRFVGLCLLTTAVSAIAYIFMPIGENSFPAGNGGVLGIGAGSFLLKHLAKFGSYIVIFSSAFVGAFLLSDSLVIMLFRWIGIGSGKMVEAAGTAVSAAREHSEQLKDIWVRLSQRQEVDDEPASEKKLRPSIALAPEGQVRPKRTDDLLIEDSLEQEEEAGGLRKKLKIGKKKKAKVEPEPSVEEEVVDDSPDETLVEAYIPDKYEDYQLPPLDLLHEAEFGFSNVQERMVKEKAYELENLLKEFSLEANVVNAEPGPAITMYELELAAGIKVSQIRNLSNDVARALGAQSVRVVAPLPGRHTIGIEVPNSQREIVRLKDLIENADNRYEKMNIPLFLGKDSSGEVLFSDLAAMPHLLIAGTTGSGKSVCINSIITSIMMQKRPDEVKLILIDPKMVEMTAFDSIPHLMCPIVTETHRAEQILEWATTKMDERYALLSEAKVKNISEFNRLGAEEVIRRFDPSTPEEEAMLPKKLPYIVIIVDELADLMMTAGKEIEAYIVRLAQKSRAIGIHLVLATQRPQATVVTGLIKSNMPARISFRVAARMDSRIILDQNGGETLLGQGDMLFLKPGTSDLIRAQGAFLEDEEVLAVADHLKEVAAPQFHPELMQLNTIDISSAQKDDMFDDAVRVVIETKRGSVSLLQRRLNIGYARASRIIEMMAVSGILGEYKGSQAREVLMTLDEWDKLQKQMIADATAGFADLAEDDEQPASEVDAETEEVDEYEDEEYDEDDE